MSRITYIIIQRVFIVALLVMTSAQSSAQYISKNDFRTDKHPRVFVTSDERQDVLLKIKNTDWASNIYKSLKNEIDPLVSIHEKNPSYIVSRMQMHWQEGKRYTHFYTKGNYIAVREGNAKYPTVRVTYGRAASNSVPKAPLNKVIPYSDGELTMEKRANSYVKNPIPSSDSRYAHLNLGNDWQVVPFIETGLGTETLNRSFIYIAWKSSILYYLSGEKKYAKLAADILWTFVRGASQQEQVNPQQQKNAHGFLSFETLGDTRHFSTIPLAYDMIYDYLKEEYFDQDQYRKGIDGELWAPAHSESKQWALGCFEVMFKKLIDNKLTRGGALHGNWNTNEHQSAMLYALALDNDSEYKDGRGREYYLNKLIYGPTTDMHGAYVDVLRANISPVTGLWPEAPAGYGQGSTAQLVRFGFIYYKNGIDLLSKDPLLKKASLAMPQMLFPNGYVTCFGDASYARMNIDQAEMLLVYAKDKRDKEMMNELAELMTFSDKRNLTDEFYTSLFFFLPEIPKVQRAPQLARTSYSSVYSLIFERNIADDYRNALAFTLSGYNEQTGHRQPNGMSIELYGRGHILAPDQGIGADYWSADTHRYKINVAAHNTVTPNGKPADYNISQKLEIKYAEPTINDGESPRYAISPDNQFVDVLNHFNTKEVKAEQRRMLSIVRTSDMSGYYVDIFRSKTADPTKEYHDYIYHNMGVGSSMLTADGNQLAMTGNTLDTLSGFGYEFFKTKGSLESNKTWGVDFDFGIDSIHMRMFMLGDTERTIYDLDSPNNHRYYLSTLKQNAVPAVLVRQKGSAWDRPFVAVYEPYGNGVDAKIKGISTLQNGRDAGVVKFTVEHRQKGRVDHIINTLDSDIQSMYMGITMKGVYGVASYCRDNLLSFYVGSCKYIKLSDIEIRSESGDSFNACFQMKNGILHYTTDRALKIKTNYKLQKNELN